LKPRIFFLSFQSRSTGTTVVATVASSRVVVE